MGAVIMRKFRFIADRHKVYMPPLMKYVSVVLRDGVCIALIMEALNILDVNYANVQNAYLNANPKERAWF